MVSSRLIMSSLEIMAGSVETASSTDFPMATNEGLFVRASLFLSLLSDSPAYLKLFPLKMIEVVDCTYLYRVYIVFI
jgi:hypothetical protein